ncbi:MAG: 3D domain-containing protein [Parcubacteria group bacterium]
MRILALTVLAVLSSALVLGVGAQAQEPLAQNTKQNTGSQKENLISNADQQRAQSIDEKKIFSANDSFIRLAYIVNVKYPALKAAASKQSLFKSQPLPEGSFVVNASAYTAAADECGKSDGITASGVKVHRGTLACPRKFPFGTKMEIEGMGIYTCEDRGGAIKDNHVDIYMPTKAEAFGFGRKNLIATVIN